MTNNPILDKINQRQRQIILHSVLYYQFDTNKVSDATWNRWAKELVQLQEDYPSLTEQSGFYMTMKDFDASTGFHLADNAWGVQKALYIMNIDRSVKCESVQ
jgi:NAD-dependent DNA ligase